MKPLTVAAAALAVFFLLLSMMISVPEAAPAAGSGMDRCLLCHPTAHPAGWTMKLHVTELKAGEVSSAECTRCHDTQYCVDCHAQVQAAQRSDGGHAQTAP